ncbi:MAG TPA: hypothetical protein VJI96_02750 [Candidatus Andersenbacteria bacterium]|nr:hypothetical protein [Candidatus Andersenbacteria bacterium]
MGTLDTLSSLVEVLGIVLLYFVIGFGPGFIVGLLFANRVFGKNLPLRMEKNIASIKKATEHNSQWHPSNPKWK